MWFSEHLLFVASPGTTCLDFSPTCPDRRPRQDMVDRDFNSWDSRRQNRRWDSFPDRNLNTQCVWAGQEEQATAMPTPSVFFFNLLTWRRHVSSCSFGWFKHFFCSCGVCVCVYSILNSLNMNSGWAFQPCTIFYWTTTVPWRLDFGVAETTNAVSFLTYSWHSLLGLLLSPNHDGEAWTAFILNKFNKQWYLVLLFQTLTLCAFKWWWWPYVVMVFSLFHFVNVDRLFILLFQTGHGHFLRIDGWLAGTHRTNKVTPLYAQSKQGLLGIPQATYSGVLWWT